MTLELVDAHVHFWDRARLDYRWLDGYPAIAGSHTPSELATESGELGAQSLVFVESDAGAGRSHDEVAWVEELSQRDPRIQAIVAFAELDRGAATLAALDELVRHPLVRGVRHSLQDQRDPSYCLRPAFVDGVFACGERQLSFDVCIRHGQLPSLTELVRRCPETVFVLDHAAKPDIARGLLDPWRAHLRVLAQQPNVVCKLSGLVTEADPRSWTLDKVRPFAAHVLDCFGTDRVLFGSDWPVVKLGGGYERWLQAALSLLELLPTAARQAVLAGNARRVYRLP